MATETQPIRYMAFDKDDNEIESGTVDEITTDLKSKGFIVRVENEHGEFIVLK